MTKGKAEKFKNDPSASEGWEELIVTDIGRSIVGPTDTSLAIRAERYQNWRQEDRGTVEKRQATVPQSSQGALVLHEWGRRTNDSQEL